MMVCKIREIGAMLFVAYLLSACSGATPNNISLITTPGVCVTSQVAGYEATQSSYSNPFPLNAYMPANSPYCMAVTIVNNNNGANANNIQVFNSGLQVSYSNGVNQLTSYMLDPNAAGIPVSNFPGGPVQQLGNLAIFDPNNCVTTIGARVNTLNRGGGRCQFYLQLVGESLTMGVYPISLNVNYTNGNASYNVYATINQKVNLYAGGQFSLPSNNFAKYNPTLTNFESVSGNYPESQIKALARDAFGNIYASSESNIYFYSIIKQWNNLNFPASAGAVNDLATDNFGNIYVASNSGLWVYNISKASSSWQQLGAAIANLTSVQVKFISGTSSQIAVANNSEIAQCTWQSGGSTSSCVWSAYTLPLAWITNPASLAQDPNSSALFLANESSAYMLESNVLAQFNDSVATSGNVTSIAVDSKSYIYPTYLNTNLTNPAIFSDLNSSSESQLVPVQSNSGATLNGAANGVAMQNLNISSLTRNSLVIYSNNTLSSNDFANSAYVVYLSLGNPSAAAAYAPQSKWQPINGVNGVINNVVFASSLTN